MAVRRWGIPAYVPGWESRSFSEEPPRGTRWARFGSSDAGTGVHLFVDDWRLESLARGSFGGLGAGRIWATEPDFSILAGMPEVVQRYQCYRSRYVGHVMRRRGLSTVPVLGWAGSDPVEWSCWGVVEGSAVAVRGPGPDLAERRAWAWGYVRALAYVRPSGVLVFGVASRVRGVLDACGVPWRGEKLQAGRRGVAAPLSEPFSCAD